MIDDSNIVILGAGPAGLALAMKLLRNQNLDTEVIVIESEDHIGGLAASFKYNGLFLDYGSHRLHPTTSSEIMNDICSLLKSELLYRPRYGRIRLSGRFIKFPLAPLNLALNLPLSFITGMAKDIVTKPFRKKINFKASFADYLLDSLGETICYNFYFPYARKLWGLSPDEISVIQAQKRISASKISKIFRKIISQAHGIRRKKAKHFYYPMKGFGQISQVLAQEVELLGGKILLSTRATAMLIQKERGIKLKLSPSFKSKNRHEGKNIFNQDGLKADFVFSTIPVKTLINLLHPNPTQEIKEAAANLRYRGMILYYLILETDKFTPYDAHYFPEENIIFSRMSEPKNYSGAQMPFGLTGLCFEIPCSVGDHIWNSSENEITAKIVEDLKKVDLQIESAIKFGFYRRVPKAYPVYDKDFNTHFSKVDDYLTQIPGLVSLGRQGLFVHDNTHHTIEMAYRASECLEPGLIWNSELWNYYRKQFSKNVVED